MEQKFPLVLLQPCGHVIPSCVCGMLGSCSSHWLDCGRIACLRAAWLYNEVLAQQREEKKEKAGGEEGVVPGHSGVEHRCQEDTCFSLGYLRLRPLVEGAQRL